MTCKEISSTGRSECHAEAKADPISWLLPRHEKSDHCLDQFTAQTLRERAKEGDIERERKRKREGVNSSVTVPRGNQPEKYRKIEIKMQNQ